MKSSTACVLFALALVPGTLGAFMPRRSVTAGECFACPYDEGGVTISGGGPYQFESVTGDTYLVCRYQGAFTTVCQYSVSTGALLFPGTGSAPNCDATAGDTNSPFACPNPGLSTTYIAIDAAGDLHCGYTDPTAGSYECVYDLQGTVTGPASCPAPDTCNDEINSRRRRALGEDNFTAVKRKQAKRARVPAPRTPRPQPFTPRNALGRRSR